jgi:hypothetical protein
VTTEANVVKILGSTMVALSLVFLGQPHDARAAQIAELFASDAAAFGLSVGTAGNTLAVGSPLASAGGVVYVFQQSGSNFSQTARVEPSGANSAAVDMGFSVAYDGTTLVAGAPAQSIGAGAAYVFVQSPNFTQAAVLTAADGASFDMFGNAVSVSGSIIAVGAPDKVGGGAAYIFAASGSTWFQQAKLLPADTASLFGSSVSVQGTRVVVGASGGAYVFAQGPQGSWAEQRKLTPSGGAAGDRFGASVSFSPNMIVVGAPGENSSAGAAYVFTSSGSSWTQTQQLLAPDGATSDQFGLSVAATAGAIVVGAQGHAGLNGAAYVYAPSGPSWTLQQEVAASDAAAGDVFGHSVAIIGNDAVVGAPRKTSSRGAVYVFSPPPPAPVPALGGMGALFVAALLLLAGTTVND